MREHYLAKVSWGLFGLEVDPDRVTAEVRLVPTSAWRRGEAVGASRVPKVEGKWVVECESTSRGDSQEVDDAAQALLAKVWPGRRKLARLAGEMNARTMLSIWWEPSETIGDFGCGGPVLSKLASMANEVTVYVVPAPKRRRTATPRRRKVRSS